MKVDEMRDYYRLLGVTQTATVSEIHKAYWQLASRRHPDRGGSHEEMVQLVEAWKILSNPDKRARYDQLRTSRHDGWQNRKFNADVQEARKRAGGYVNSSWAEFEEIYQKAFYTFNKDFYGEDIDVKAAGPYSPLMGSKGVGQRSEAALKSKPADSSLHRSGGTVSLRILKAAIPLAAVVAALLFYRNYGDIGRYVPLGPQDTTSLQMLDTANGAVYSVKKRDGAVTSPWIVTVPPFPNEKKWPHK